MMVRWMSWGLVMVCVSAQVGFSQAAPGPNSGAAAPNYVDENPKDPAPLRIEGVEGKVQGLGGDRMPRVTVLLFTENGHSLIATVMTDRDGKFRFDKVDHGLYRVVAKDEGLCPANIPIDVESSLIKHKKLVITMQPKDIDTCSYAVAK
jgi:hypothetical protein